jgi:archaetidylserine synthase
MIKLLSGADLITLLNAILGFLALLFMYSGQYHLAASMIFLGLLADGLDGIIARRFGNGKIGESLESLADMISLSIAPLILFYFMYFKNVITEPFQHSLFAGILVFSLLCSIIRLSSFPHMKHKEYFIGLPTSASALFLVLMTYIVFEMWYIVPAIVVLSILMISPIRFPKPTMPINLITAVLIVLVILFNGLYSQLAPLVLLGALFVYIIGGPLYLFWKKPRPVSGTDDSRIR